MRRKKTETKRKEIYPSNQASVHRFSRFKLTSPHLIADVTCDCDVDDGLRIDWLPAQNRNTKQCSSADRSSRHRVENDGCSEARQRSRPRLENASPSSGRELYDCSCNVSPALT